MTRTTLAIGVGILAVAGIAAARHDEDAESVKPVAAYDIVEKLDGKDTPATTVEVTLEPGKAGAPTATPARSSATSSRASTSGRSTTSPRRSSRPARPSTSRPGACTGCRRTPAQGQDPPAGRGAAPADVKDIVIPEPEKD